MKVHVLSYVHAANGLAIEVVPETDAESAVLSAAWKHGSLETAYSSKSPTSKSFLVRVFQTTAKDE